MAGVFGNSGGVGQPIKNNEPMIRPKARKLFLLYLLINQ